MVEPAFDLESGMKILSISALVVAVAACAASLGPAQAGERDRQPMNEVERVCAPHPDMATHEAAFADKLAVHLLLTDAQKAAFKQFQDARAKAVEAATSRLCAKKPDVASFEGRLIFH
jgi:hypothetical protein